ncbi:glycosyltransferase family 2 protein [Patescibacteria group bacterium]|nr:glycosyltransferase family 2 protein [Patescibacteria group bacterium]
MTRLSIVMPVYNEEATLKSILQKVVAVKLPWKKEIIVVNDASKDNSGKIIQAFAKKHPEVKYFEHEANQGKGAAVRTGFSKVTGDYAIIQDADLEYDPEQIPRLLAKAEKFPGTVVYGSRLTSPPVLFGRHRTVLVMHYFANRVFSLVNSLLYGTWLTDMETGYKLIPREAIKKINLKANGFEMEPEVTAKLLKSGFKIREVAITTKPRSFDQGKKFNTFKDGTQALWCIFKYRFAD